VGVNPVLSVRIKGLEPPLVVFCYLILLANDFFVNVGLELLVVLTGIHEHILV